MHNKVKGTVAELCVIAELLQRGFVVSYTQGDYAGYDIISDWKGTINRIQVKSTQTLGEYNSYHLTTGRGNYSKKKYTPSDCDVILCVVESTFYIVPIKAITTLKMRFCPNSGKGKWEKYRNSWSLLKSCKRKNLK